MNRLFRFDLLALFLLLLSDVSFGQLFNEKESQTGNQQNLMQQLQQQQNMQNIKTAVLDGPIDPAEYIVGPGDIYSVNVWISPPVNFQLPVTPEGSIIIPTVGEVHVAGLHLDDAKKKVIADIRKKYIAGDISFTLMTPRVFAVTIKGVVPKEGTFFFQSTNRVDAALATTDSTDYDLLKKKIGQGVSSLGSRRKIVIRHRDGTRGTADLEMYYALRDRRYDPLLQDGDVVIVPRWDSERNFVGIYGAVNDEGVYEYIDGDSLVSMLKMARGLSTTADSNSIEIVRSDKDGSHLTTINCNLALIVSGKQPDIPLHQGDRIVVREQLSLQRDYKVRVEGEVMYPGTYPITKDSTLLSDIVKEAGGFTPFASMELSQIFRRSVSQQDIISDRLESARGGVTPEDSTYFNLETAIRLNRELVVTDFVGLFEKNDESKDVYLRNGDEISIGSKKQTIYVFGQVVHPGHVGFLSGQNYRYYVDKAGGFTDYARDGDIRIIKANTKQWLAPDETTIEPGDYVWVPKEPYHPFAYYMQLYSQVFSVLATIATLAVLVVQLKK